MPLLLLDGALASLRAFNFAIPTAIKLPYSLDCAAK